MAFYNLRDGDAVVTRHGFIFYIFGYTHPDVSYEAFLKYVPEAHANKFDLSWLDTRWNFKNITLVRPRDLYSPVNHARLIMTFQRYFPNYVSFSDELGRWMIRVPRTLISEAYIPSRQLMILKQKGTGNMLEKKALELIEILSKHSEVSIGFFGIHGSIALGMHQEFSDIDIAVYGAVNYKLVKRSLTELEGEGLLTILRENVFDKRRLNRGTFRDTGFVINATRLFSEIDRENPSVRRIDTAEVKCLCKNVSKSVFRPATYLVSECIDIEKSLINKFSISQIVSMNGLYRDVIRDGEKMRARGTIEELTYKNGEKRFRLAVGTGTEGEYLSWNGSQACSSTTSPS